MRRSLVKSVAMMMVLSGCASAPRDPFAAAAKASVTWPAPPEPPRVEYVTTISKHQDVLQEGGVGSTFARIFGGEIDSRMVRPYAVAVHPEGGLLVTDPGLGCVHFLDWKRGKYRRLGAGVEGGLPSPVGVAVAKDGSILVSDSRRAAIERFSTGGKYLGRFAAGYTPERPAGIAVDQESGNVFVVDVTAQQIAVLSPEGEMTRTIGTGGSEPGQFNFPTHLALDAQGKLLVADSMNFRIQRLEQDGTPIGAFGKAGDIQGDFAHPKGIVAASPDVFVAVEGLYDSLIFFDAKGSLLMSLGGSGSDPGQFWLPAGLAYDPTRRLLFVADSYNSRVQVFRLTETPVIGEVAP
jgi:DNA-binding beta-propeller fold protein YncE